MFVCTSSLYLALLCLEAAECNAEVNLNLCVSFQGFLWPRPGRPKLKRGPHHNTGWRMVTCTRFLLPSKGQWHLWYEMKTPAAGHGVLISICALFTVAVGKREQTRGKPVPSGQSPSGMFNMLGTLCPCLETSLKYSIRWSLFVNRSVDSWSCPAYLCLNCQCLT